MTDSHLDEWLVMVRNSCCRRISDGLGDEILADTFEFEAVAFHEELVLIKFKSRLCLVEATTMYALNFFHLDDPVTVFRLLPPPDDPWQGGYCCWRPVSVLPALRNKLDLVQDKRVGFDTLAAEFPIPKPAPRRVEPSFAARECYWCGPGLWRRWWHPTKGLIWCEDPAHGALARLRRG